MKLFPAGAPLAPAAPRGVAPGSPRAWPQAPLQGPSVPSLVTTALHGWAEVSPVPCLTCCLWLRWDRVPQKLSCPAPCWAGEGLGVPACTTAPKDGPTEEGKGTSPQGLRHPSPGQRSRDGAAATPLLGLAVPRCRKGHPSSDTLMQQHPSAPCPLAAKQEPSLDAPMGAGLMPASPVAPVSTRLPPRSGIAPPSPRLRKVPLLLAGVETGQVGRWVSVGSPIAIWGWTGTG